MSSELLGEIEIEIYNSGDSTSSFRRRLLDALSDELGRLGIDSTDYQLVEFSVDRHGDAVVSIRAEDLSGD